MPPLRLGSDLPSFAGATGWYNGDAATVDSMKGPKLVHFWAVSCYLCKNNLPKLAAWREKYAPKGLSFIAVHMPRQDGDTDQVAVEKALGDFQISEVCAVDNDHQLKDAFGNDQTWVPLYFLYDSEGKLKSRAAGENGVAIIATALEKMFESN